MSLVLERTTILPTDDKSLARSMFASLVHEQAKILLVVLGKGEDAETTVQRADRLTGHGGVPRWVCWARRPDHIQEEVAPLIGGADLAERLEATRAFSLSLSDEVRDEIQSADPVPSLTRLFLAFVRAEQ